MWTCSTASEPFPQVRQGLGKGSQSQHHAQCPLPVAWVARKAPASQVDIARKRQWMSSAPPKNRKPIPAREPGPGMNSFHKHERGKRKRWDAGTEVRRFERRKPARTRAAPLPFGGARGRGRSGGLSFVSRGEALRRWLTVGSWKGVRGRGDSPCPTTNATCQTGPGGLLRGEPVGLDRCGRGIWPSRRSHGCHLLRASDRSAWPGGGTMGPNRGAPGAAPAPGGQDHHTQAGPAAQKREREPSRRVPSESPPRCQGERPRPSRLPAPRQKWMGEERESGGAGVRASPGGTKAAPAAEHRRPSGRKRGAQGRLLPTTGCPARVAPPGSGPPDPEPRAAGARLRRLTGSYSCCWDRRPWRWWWWSWRLGAR